MPANPARFRAILDVLTRHEVKHVVVGGVGAALQGAPIVTFDLGVVPSREVANLPPLLAALQELDAWYREHAAEKLRPTADRLESTGHHLLATRFGFLDLLGEIGGGLGYEELISRAEELDLGLEAPVQVLQLEELIRLKEAMDREKDRAMLPFLRQALAERRRAKDSVGGG